MKSTVLAQQEPTSTRRVLAARYLRVSRLDQNPNLQADETGDFIVRRGWSLTDTYLDQGVSGSKERRPQLDRLLADARRRRFDVLVVYRADRLFRSMRHMVITLDELGALGVGFASVNEPLDTTTPSGRLLLHLVAAMAEFERSILIERTRAGLAAAARRGVRIGRPRVRVDLEAAHRLIEAGASLRRAARSLGCGASTLARALAAAQVHAPEPSSTEPPQNP